MVAAPVRRRGPLWVRFEPVTGAGASVEVAFAVPRRVGSAVVRNRIRRRLRAAVRSLGPAVPAGRYLIGADRRAADRDFAELVATLRSLMNAQSETR